MTLSECYKKFNKVGLVKKWFSRERPDRKEHFGYGLIREKGTYFDHFAHISKYCGGMIIQGNEFYPI